MNWKDDGQIERSGRIQDLPQAFGSLRVFGAVQGEQVIAARLEAEAAEVFFGELIGLLEIREQSVVHHVADKCGAAFEGVVRISDSETIANQMP